MSTLQLAGHFFFPKFADVVKLESGGGGRQEWRSSHAHEEVSLLDAATGLTLPYPLLEQITTVHDTGARAQPHHDRIASFLRLRGKLSDTRRMCPRISLLWEAWTGL